MMNEEQFFLANAYLDGEVTDEERRLAEADPAVMAEVETLRALQREVRAVDPPSAEAREAAIAAAMTQFTSSAAAAPPAAAAAPSTVIRHRARPAYSRYLAIAAAVVGIGVLGVVITNLPADDDDTASDAPAAEETAETTDVAERTFAESDAPEDEAMIAAEAGPAEIAEDADDVAAEPTAETAGQPAEEPAGDQPPAAPGGDDGGSGDPTDLALPLAGRTADTPITTSDELGAFGAALIALIEAEQLPATPETACEPVVLDLAYLVFDDVVTEVFIGVDPQRAVVIAIDPATCDIVDEAPLPS